MSQIDLVVTVSRRLEKLLTKVYGAQGRGMHAKITDAARRLPENTEQGLRWVATMRNRVVHQDGFKLKDPAAFKAEARRLEKALRIGNRLGCVAKVLAIALLLLAGWHFFK